MRENAKKASLPPTSDLEPSPKLAVLLVAWAEAVPMICVRLALPALSRDDKLALKLLSAALILASMELVSTLNAFDVAAGGVVVASIEFPIVWAPVVHSPSAPQTNPSLQHAVIGVVHVGPPLQKSAQIG